MDENMDFFCNGKRVFAISRIFALTVYISTILVETIRKTKKKIPRIER